MSEEKPKYEVTESISQMSFPQMLDKFKGEIARALPKHLSGDRMCRIALTEFRKNPKLKQCEPKSVFAAIIQSSQLGLEVGLMGEAYLVPFKTECQLIPGFTGLMKLARNTGKIDDIYAHSVREKDEFSIQFGLDRTLKHSPLMSGSFPADDNARGPIVGYYAVAVFSDGKKTFQAMSQADVEKIRDKSPGYKMSKQYNKQSLWDTYPEEMGIKTVIRRLCKYLPKSPELAAALALDEVSQVVGMQNITVQDAIDGTWSPDYTPNEDAIDVEFSAEEKPSVDELFTIQFEKQVADLGISFAEVDRFVSANAANKKCSVESVKEAAIKEPVRFMLAFGKDMAKQMQAPVTPEKKPYAENRQNDGKSNVESTNTTTRNDAAAPKPILCPSQKKGVLPEECAGCAAGEKCDQYAEWKFEQGQKGE